MLHLDVSKIDRNVAHVAMVMLRVFQAHVSGVSSVIFCMLQVLYLDISKVDRDVAHVAMVFQLYAQIFYLFYTYVAKISSGCCKSRSGV